MKMQAKKREPEKIAAAETPAAGAKKTIVISVWAVAAIILLAVLLVVLPQALQLLGKPAGSAPELPTAIPTVEGAGGGVVEALAFAPKISDSAIYAALEENGVEGALVEIGKITTLVSLSVPAGADAKKTAYLALGAAGALSPASQTVTVEAFDGIVRKTFSTSAANVHALLEGSVSEEEFEKRVSESYSKPIK